MNREQLLETIHINEGDRIDIITEKLFCYALIQHGTVVTAEVLRDYEKVKKIFFG